MNCSNMLHKLLLSFKILSFGSATLSPGLLNIDNEVQIYITKWNFPPIYINLYLILYVTYIYIYI